MNFSPNYALYYPTIHFQSYEWLLSASLIWDKIYRIVPESVKVSDPDNVRLLMEDGNIGVKINPEPYVKKVAESFLKKIKSRHWKANALSLKGNYLKSEMIHKDKIDVVLKNILIDSGTIETYKEWLIVPKHLSSLYMTFLADHIAKLSNLQLISDLYEAWIGQTYFHYDGKILPYDLSYNSFSSLNSAPVLAFLILEDFIPENINNINPKKILKFREKFKEERHNYFMAIKKAAIEINKCNDPKIIKDLFEDLKKDISNTVDDYKKCSRYLKVTAWTGFKLLPFPISGELIQRFSERINMDFEIPFLFRGLGLILASVFWITETRKKIRNLSKNFEYSYLLNIKRMSGGGNQLLNYLKGQMHDFIYD